ncbi:MAG TPA: YdaS family helix-turn-helix protein [Steroidobacteraceae bacterium]|nr:YdaS family helix-turn-helix protein [Steroidobacteraceae bacterium]
MSALDQAVEQIGLQPLAQLCGVSYQAIRKWQRSGRLPRTEWTGETDYATRIEQATQGRITRAALLTPPKRVAAAMGAEQAGAIQ